MTPTALKEARQRLGLSQTDMADAIGRGYRQYSDYERGVDPIPRTVELAVLAVLHLPADLLRTGPDC